MKRLQLVVTACAVVTLGCKTGDSTSDSKTQSAVDHSKIDIDPELGEFLWDGEAGAGQDVADAIAESVRRRVAGSGGVARRDAHPKAHGCVRARFDVLPDLPATLAQGVFVSGKSYPAWIRFSNGSSDPKKPDIDGDGRGMAIKLVDVPGDKILEDERQAQTQDFLLINYPVFFNKDPRDYVKLMRRLNSTNPLGVAAAIIPLGLDGASILAKILLQKMANPAQERYWSETPYRLGNEPLKQAVKFSARPCQLVDNTNPPKNPDPNYMRLALVDTLAKGDICYEFLVQPRPNSGFEVENSMVEWNEKEAPFYKVATITIPKQVFDTPSQRDYCDNLSFTPWHSLPEHRPLGAANRVRRVVYQAISKLRHDLNQQPRVEPVNLNLPK